MDQSGDQTADPRVSGRSLHLLSISCLKVMKLTSEDGMIHFLKGGFYSCLNHLRL